MTMLQQPTIKLALTLATAVAAHGQGLGPGTVLNIDIGDSGGTYAGQGALADPGNDHWNGVFSTGAALLASDGVTLTSASINLVTANGFAYGNANSLLADYQYISAFFGPPEGELAISGLTPNTRHVLYIYSAGDKYDQGGIFTIGDASIATAGSTSDQFIEGENYTVLETVSDASGQIEGTFGGFDTAGGVINGIQLYEGALLPKVAGISGAESPTVHSPGDTAQVHVAFNETVTLSATGGAAITVNFGGTAVQGTQVGETTGQSLTFEYLVPQVTTTDAALVADSLTLQAGVTLRDTDLNDVPLSVDGAALPNDQASTTGLSVYPSVPGLDESPYYRFRVREIGGTWMSPFAWSTQCIDFAPDVPYGYYQDDIGGWSHTYCNFEMANNVPIEVEITRLDPTTQLPVDIQSAVAHPRRKVRSWRVEDGKAYVRLDKPTLFAVDIDGQLDRNPTPDPAFRNETAIHCVTVFANPFILDAPDLSDPSVLAIEPGQLPPNDGAWSTLYFKPGVHEIFQGPTWDVGEGFRLRSDRSYYIPGDAIVHGNFNNGRDSNDARNIRVFGHGTISGERLDHPIMFGLTEVEEQWVSSPLDIADDAKGCRVEGVTFADPSFHTCVVRGTYSGHAEDHNHIRWCKAITWRANGDGISANGSSFLEDCFLRTQDDGTYILGAGIRRMTYWTDVNGMPLRCSQLTKVHPFPYRLGKLFVEDIDVIYARSGFGPGPGRSVIGYPEPNASDYGNTGQHVVFRDINFEDPLPVRSLFGWDLTTGMGVIDGVRFENVRAAAPTVDNDPNSFFGGPSAPIDGITFDNVTLAGQHFGDIADFTVNGSVSGFEFVNTQPETMTYMGSSGYGKWYVNGDWDTGVEPANNDVVEHTTVAGTLAVDAPAYAGTVKVGHAGTATLELRQGGLLTVADALEVGAAGTGSVRLLGGRLRIQSADTSALSVASGSIHLERGRLIWAGNHIDDVRALHAAGKITFDNGRKVPAFPTRSRGRIAVDGPNILFAVYNAAEDVTTIVAVKVAGPKRL